MSKLTFDEYSYIEETIGTLMTAGEEMSLVPEVKCVTDGLRLTIGSLVTLGQGVDALAQSTPVEGMARGLSREIVNAIRGLIERQNNAKFLQGVTLTACDVIPSFNPECN